MKRKKTNPQIKQISSVKDLKQWKIEQISVRDLKHWKKNPRVHDEATIEKLAASILLHGVRSPLNVWRKNMTVYKGNLTLRALKKLHISTAPVVLHDFKSEAAAVAYAISDNKASEFAEYDDKIMSQLLQTDELHLTPENTGFESKEFREAQLLWESDLDIDDMKLKDEPKYDRIKIICLKSMKEEIIKLLKGEYEGEDIKIQG